MSDLMKVTDANFEEFINRRNPAVVDCRAPGCGPCRMIAPVIEELAQEDTGKMDLGKPNVDDNREVAARFGIMNIPPLPILKDGNEVDRIVGFGSRDDLAKRLEKHL